MEIWLDLLRPSNEPHKVYQTSNTVFSRGMSIHKEPHVKILKSFILAGQFNRPDIGLVKTNVKRACDEDRLTANYRHDLLSETLSFTPEHGHFSETRPFNTNHIEKWPNTGVDPRHSP